MGTPHRELVSPDGKGGVVSASDGSWRGRSLASDPVAAAMPQIVWVARPDGWVISFNRRWHEYTGLSHLQSEGWGWQAAIHPDDRSVCSARWRGALASGEAYEIEYRFRGADGAYRWFLGRGLPARDKSGGIVEWIGTCTDIDDQKRAQEQLRRLQDDLEARVSARTAELDAAIDGLRAEMLGRQRTQAALAESEDRFRGAFDEAPIGMIIASPEGRCLQVNRRMGEMLGYSPGELLGVFSRDITHPDDLAGEVAGILPLVEGRVGHLSYAKRYLHKLGHVVRAQLTRTVVRDDVGKVVYSVTLAEDLTPRQRAEAALRAQADLLRSILDNIGEAVMVADLDGRLLSSNPAAGRMFGPFSPEYGPGGLVGEFEIFRADGTTPFPPEEMPISRAIRGESVDNIEGVRRGGGLPDLAWCVNSARPIRDEAGQVVGGVIVCQDITARKAAERAVEGERHRLLEVIKNAPVAIAMLDSGRRFLAHSEKWLDDYDLKGRPILFKGFDEVLPLYPARFREIHRRALDGEVLSCPEDVLELADGRVVQQRWAVHPWHAPDGSIGGIIVVTESIDELVRAREAALEASRLKSEFLANMSHEIRTPMNGVLGMTELLLETSLDEEQRDYAATIRQSADALLTILNDILDYSKIEAGKLAVEAVPFDLGALIEDVADFLAPGAHQKGLRIASRIPPDLPEALKGDPARLRQILINLVGNAVKFTGAGEVVIAVEMVGRPGDDPSLCLSVRDTGIGIPRNRLDAIFESFTQAAGGTSREFGGTGLGLTICRRLAELMGGTISVESEPGRGSTFRVLLTLKALTPAGPPQTVPPAGLHVLIIDDDETSRAILAGQLQSWGCRVEVMGSVGSSRAVSPDPANGAPFDVVLLDERIDLAPMRARIEAGPGVASVPIVLLHSLGTRPPERPSPPPRTVAKLTKPIRRAELAQALIVATGGAVESPDEPASTAPDVPETPPLNLRILLAEDNEVNRKVALRLLQRWGCQAVAVADGREAVEAASRDVFDLILMDVQMPVMDGLAATAEIRRRERETGGHVPILAMTASAMEEDRRRCLASGMDDYVTKPVRSPLLREAFDRLFPGKAARPPSPWRSDRLRESCDDPAFEREVLGVFLVEAPTLLGRLDEALHSGAAGAASGAAHSLKGCCLTIGADSLAAAFLTIEDRAGLGEIGPALGAFEALREPWARLLESLREGV